MIGEKSSDCIGQDDQRDGLESIEPFGAQHQAGPNEQGNCVENNDTPNVVRNRNTDTDDSSEPGQP